MLQRPGLLKTKDFRVVSQKHEVVIPALDLARFEPHFFEQVPVGALKAVNLAEHHEVGTTGNQIFTNLLKPMLHAQPVPVPVQVLVICVAVSEHVPLETSNLVFGVRRFAQLSHLTHFCWVASQL